MKAGYIELLNRLFEDKTIQSIPSMFVIKVVVTIQKILEEEANSNVSVQQSISKLSIPGKSRTVD